MDMWKAFENSAARNTPQAAILFDKFHVMWHLGKALDKVRKSEYGRLAGRERSYINGQKYTLLSHKENLAPDGKRALKKLLSANKRINIAYLLKESFGQLWNYTSEALARKFFERRDSLKWQRQEPYRKFAAMIDRHWAGIAAYCKPENKVALGFVDGLNNKIRVIQRRAYGLRDEEHLRLKVLTCMLPPIWAKNDQKAPTLFHEDPEYSSDSLRLQPSLPGPCDCWALTGPARGRSQGHPDRHWSLSCWFRFRAQRQPG
jgi:transposase